MDPIPSNPNIQISNTNSPYIPIWTIRQPNVDYMIPPVVVNIGNPIIDMPGCVTLHKDNKRHVNGVPIDKNLEEDDPDKAMTVCPSGEYPTYDAMNYEPEQLTIIREQEAPPVAPPPDPPESPETPQDAIPKNEDPDCPGPNAPRIGDVAQNQEEKVSGHELQNDPVNPGKKICVVLYEDITAVEQYLPTPQVASTTAVIATVATGSALLAKPLADLMLRVFRPAIKKAIGTFQKILGKGQQEMPSLRERRDLQRERTKAIRQLRRMKSGN